MGQVLGQVGALPDVYTELEINFYLLRRLLGVRTLVRCNVHWLLMMMMMIVYMFDLFSMCCMDVWRQGDEKQSKVTKLSKNEVLMLNIGSMCTGARVLAVRLTCGGDGVFCMHDRLAQVKHDLAKLQLTTPVCTKEGEKVALSRRIDKHWRLIGWGQIQKGLRMDLPGRS